MYEKKMLVSAILFGVFGLTFLFAGGGKESPQGASGKTSYTIEVSGSTSVTPLMEMLAAEYSKVKPEITININGTGSSDGITAASQKATELGMSSRTLKPEEKGYGLTELIIAIDGIAVIVNPANPVQNLSIEQIRDIYAGNITDWRQVGGKAGKIAVVSREPGSGTRGAFEEIIAFKDALVLGATEFDGTGAVKAEVSKNADAIGYISLGSMDNSVKTVSVEGVPASTDNVINGTYSIARPFIILYLPSNIRAETKQFLDWVMSSDGQAIAGTSWIAVN
ncbi:phosphate ABC transporter substrate-binding protein [Brucepastera parasyntrophica]|uniref:phosphate ABC transporter substrate-binding protein n=1 Tax=Brucepastera parasyntrophica TaxID=2880008 RepID=UPI00210A3D34|nr:phosphate ABC transporter substrate-binding protein [Brucepastera parasyntrophica]ULQ60671.1 phosphate ABC transporter substrate-binding protein [Brucepastera parasyntrophica]